MAPTPNQVQNMIEDPIPPIKLTAYTPETSHDESPIKVLNTFGEEWGMKPKFDIKAVRQSGRPTTYVATLTVGVRKADGCGATVSEAKSEAAARVVDELLLFVPADRRLSYKQVVKTDPNKDILYILNGICTEYKLKTPSYNLESKGKDGYKYTAYLGELSASGEAGKKRVAIRIAAVKLYKLLRKLYNADKLPFSAKN